ncbi:MAG: nitroreductase family protein [Nanoarchaeota archaeon]|nr:nitroreductase family protein [Nanoarchaeota archaeon]
MGIRETILARSSIRKYQDRKVPLEVIGEIMEHARLAPSAGNSQNWRFVIVLDREKREKIAEASNKPWMKEAPAHIAVCNYSKKLTSLYAEAGKMFSIQDCAIIASYIQLLAVDKGLSTCWVGAMDEFKIGLLLKCPEDVSVEAIITLGYSAEEEEKKKVRNEAKNLCFFEQENASVKNAKDEMEKKEKAVEQCIHERRSIRNYQNKDVPAGAINEILNIARLAPSAYNAQNWRFAIAKGKAKRREIADACHGQHWMTEAPVHIVVCNFGKKLIDMHKNKGHLFAVQDCAIIASYMQLLAVEYGLGTCWVGAFDAGKLDECAHGINSALPPDAMPEIVLTLGFPDDAKHAGHIRNEFHDFCYFDKWGNMDVKKEESALKAKVREKTGFLKGLFSVDVRE